MGDATYIPTDEGWLFLATVIDACSRRLLGWSITDHLRTELCLDALDAAVGTRGGKTAVVGVVFHSDHGTQYTSDAFGAACAAVEITQSMGTVGDSYDCDAMAESFFASFKRELVDGQRFSTRAEARAGNLRVVRLVQHHEAPHVDWNAAPSGVRSPPQQPATCSMNRVRPAGGCSDHRARRCWADLRATDKATAELAVVLGAEHRLKAADAVHLATAVGAGADRFLTNNHRDCRQMITEIAITYPADLPEPVE